MSFIAPKQSDFARTSTYLNDSEQIHLLPSFQQVCCDLAFSLIQSVNEPERCIAVLLAGNLKVRSYEGDLCDILDTEFFYKRSAFIDFQELNEFECLANYTNDIDEMVKLGIQKMLLLTGSEFTNLFGDETFEGCTKSALVFASNMNWQSWYLHENAKDPFDTKAFGVYLITNKFNNKKYIGKFSMYVNGTVKRWNDHQKMPSRKSEASLIQTAIYEDGVRNFNYEVIKENITEKEAFDLERQLVELHKTNVHRYGIEFGYNQNDGGAGNSGGLQVSKNLLSKKKNHSNEKRKHEHCTRCGQSLTKTKHLLLHNSRM